ncbi:hypothetical protein [Homoserinibacter gongjuensis]|uniref:hypothetical protein n=1 Tax=Homoserinibacter gongjuensis TaxID=1162968 RepID=UPI0024E11A4D|nr:hypothetical protein [Homoserinibacter gongjuensis]
MRSTTRRSDAVTDSRRPASVPTAITVSPRSRSRAHTACPAVPLAPVTTTFMRYPVMPRVDSMTSVIFLARAS